MKLRYPYIVTAMICLFTAMAAPAQHIAETKFAHMLETMPKPPANLKEVLETYGTLSMDQMPEGYKAALDEMEKNRTVVLKPLFDKFKANSEQAKKDKSLLAKFSAEEQKMLRDFQTLQASWGDGAFYGFSAWIEYRPGIGKLSWTKVTQPLSAGGQTYYQQLQQLEKQLNVSQFMEEAHDKEGWFTSDPKITALNEQLSKDLDAVPTKKVKFAEGSDVTVDMHDPQKSIEVLKQSDAKMQQAFKENYEQQYRWWKDNYSRIAGAAKKLDDLLTATDYGANLSGNDKQLTTVIADVQGRIWGMLYHLTNIGTKVIKVAQEANMSSAMIAEAINTMKKLPAP